MTKFFNLLSFCILASMVASCSQILQSVELEINTDDKSVQEKFNVIEKTLTIKEAQSQKYVAYPQVLYACGLRLRPVC